MYSKAHNKNELNKVGILRKPEYESRAIKNYVKHKYKLLICNTIRPYEHDDRLKTMSQNSGNN